MSHFPIGERLEVTRIWLDNVGFTDKLNKREANVLLAADEDDLIV